VAEDLIFVIVIVNIGFVGFVGGGRRLFICSSSSANGDGFKGLLKTVVDGSSITGTLGLGAVAGASSHGAALGCILMLVLEREMPAVCGFLGNMDRPYV
jgi:hypothetical protein